MFYILIKVNSFVKTHEIIHTHVVYFNIYKIYLKRCKQLTKKKKKERKSLPSVDDFTSEFFQAFKERNNINLTQILTEN